MSITIHQTGDGPITFGYSTRINGKRFRKQGFQSERDATLALQALRGPSLETVLAPGYLMRQEDTVRGRPILHYPGIYVRTDSTHPVVFWRIIGKGGEQTGIAPSVVEALLEQGKHRQPHGWKHKKPTGFRGVWRVLDPLGKSLFQFDINYRGVDGRRRRKRSETFATAEEARDALKAFRKESLVYVPQSKTPTLGDFMENRLAIYVETGRCDQEKRSQYGEIAAVLGAKRLVNDIRPEDVESFWFHIQNRVVRPGKGWKRGKTPRLLGYRRRRASWYAFTSLVRKLGELGYLDVRDVRHDGLPSPLFAALKKKWPDADHQPFAPLHVTEEALTTVLAKLREPPEREAMIRAYPGDLRKAAHAYASAVQVHRSRVRAAVMLDTSYFTAMRLGGIQRLTWGEVGERAIVHHDGKKGRSWSMPMHPDLYKVLCNFAGEIPPHERPPDELVFLNPATGLAVKSVATTLNWAVAQTGVPHFTFRHVRPLSLSAVEAEGFDSRCLARWTSSRMREEYNKQLKAAKAVDSLSRRRKLAAGGEVGPLKTKDEEVALALTDLARRYREAMLESDDLGEVGKTAFKFMKQVLDLAERSATDQETKGAQNVLNR